MRLSVAKRGRAQIWLFSSASAWKRIFTQVSLTSEVAQQTIFLALENEALKVGARAWTGSWRLKYLVLRGISRTKKVQERAMSVKEVTGEDGAKIRQL